MNADRKGERAQTSLSTHQEYFAAATTTHCGPETELTMPFAWRSRDGAEAHGATSNTTPHRARRLHYWSLVDGTVEFASVNVHDDTTIPD